MSLKIKNIKFLRIFVTYKSINDSRDFAKYFAIKLHVSLGSSFKSLSLDLKRFFAPVVF